jgi:hypothetical protein
MSAESRRCQPDIQSPWSAQVTGGTKSFWILTFLSDKAGLSACWSRGTWPDTWTCKIMRCWGFECLTSHALYSNCFRLSVQVVRCCSHLAQPCVVFHKWVGKTCGMLIDRSRDARPELGDTTRIVTSIEVRKCDRSWDIRPESHLLTKVGYMIEVASSDQSRAYMTKVMRYLHYKHV